MKRFKWILCLLAAGLLTGSAFAEEAAATNSVDLTALALQAAGLDKAELQAKVDEYKALISQKMKEIDALKEQFSAIPWKEKLGEKAMQIKGDLAEKTSALAQLKDVLGVYTDALTKAE